ncbi:MAG: D-lyxose/D-mannose family sugar isomerase [Christensenellales bacterium]|jgi:D-lyxose ketol-isomerase
MKRSEINRSLRWAKDFLEANNHRLPPMAYWDMATWRAHKAQLDTVKRTMLGWDITDFGTGSFAELGAVLYTIRNGLLADSSVGVPYCEKFILMKDGQRLPKHYHVYKTEDIINRAGGTLQIFLWNADRDGNQLDTDVRVYMDGILRTVKAGEEIRIEKGASVSLPPYVAHVFGPLPASGDLLVGEVSKVNDDNTDNFFLEPTSRFADIEEDEDILHPLCNEYHLL